MKTSGFVESRRCGHKKNFNRRLYSFDELPEWQKDNELIRMGYVRETNSFLECLKSMTYFNNESVNIYTHLVPSVTYFILLLLFVDLVVTPMFPGTTMREYIMIDFYLFGVFVCLMCSTCFHCLKQHSESHNRIWSKVDYIGIIVQITSSIVSILYYGFYDHISHIKWLSVLTLTLGVCCVTFVLNDRFNAIDYRLLRAIFFTVFGFSGVVPVLIGIYQFGLIEWLARIQLKFVLAGTIFYIFGALIYGFRIPEALAPGKFDFIGHSHQIFHLLVVLGSICHFRAVIGSYVFMRTGKNYPGLLMII
ncbi:PAQR-type receptor Ecym_3588 [Eremothecium cymbalariae DBVPG|uniref:Uncharacterized protein n=1 Tax=Eremothecium cymbalariae (strain CBS 270.75 / DBVPG 7215 / KCTC 17166 / NRRL Y-17582) TaxID=931890 RepID=G8JQS1_ERECY|nr:Hypothetical protein Ecym_3588 [Eremothecium cymbalariae DBVPG\